MLPHSLVDTLSAVNVVDIFSIADEIRFAWLAR